GGQSFGQYFGQYLGHLAALRTRATAGGAGDRVLEQRVTPSVPAFGGRVSTGPEGGRLCRWPERFDRIPLGGGAKRSATRDDGRSGPASGECYCRDDDAGGTGGRGGKYDNPDYLQYRR